MKCVKCGVELDAGARFCGSCGTQQPGAVIPQAAVRTHQKTLFQGSGVNKLPAQIAGAQAAASVPMAAPGVPDKKGPVSSAMSFAPTLAPGSAEMKAIAPSPSGPNPIAPSPSQPNPIAPSSPGPQAHRPITAPLSELPAPAKDSDLTGKLLNNRYQIGAKLGEGGFGAVYRATQVGMNRQVALKVLHAKMA